MADDWYADLPEIRQQLIKYTDPAGQIVLFDSAYTDEQIADAIICCGLRFGTGSEPQAVRSGKPKGTYE